MGLDDLFFRMFPKTAAKLASRAYDAAIPDGYRPPIGSTGSGDALTGAAGEKLRNLGRHLEENHDLSVAILDDLVTNIVGVGLEARPMVRTLDGKLAKDFNRYLSEMFEMVGEDPEVTGDYTLNEASRQIVRATFRDGEIFIREVSHERRYQYPTEIPFAFQLLETDFCPWELVDVERGIVHGVERNSWGRPTAYHFFREHPGDNLVGSYHSYDTKRIPAQYVIQPKFSRRVRQARGVSLFHAVINRLRDLKDYEESERIAAKVAADMTAYIERTGEYRGEVKNGKRSFKFGAGMIWQLLPGEKVGSLKSERPNPNLGEFRKQMMSAISGGTSTRRSSITRDYSGTYSSQRQELVESAIAYRAHFQYFARRVFTELYRRIIMRGLNAGVIATPTNIELSTLYRVDFRAPALPWIDPQKEAKAWRELVESKLESRAEIQRQRGRDPQKVLEELEEESEIDVYASAITAAGNEPAENDELEEKADDEEAAA